MKQGEDSRFEGEVVACFVKRNHQQGWLVGETLEHALAALQRELAG